MDDFSASCGEMPSTSRVTYAEVVRGCGNHWRRHQTEDDDEAMEIALAKSMESEVILL